MEYYFKYARTVGAKYANIFVSYGENSRYYITDFAYDNKYWTLIYDKQSKEPVVFNAFKEGHECIPSFVDESGVYLIGADPNYGLNILIVSSVILYKMSLEKSISDWENEHFIEEMYIQDNITASVICSDNSIGVKELKLSEPRLICYYSSQSCDACT